MDLELPNYDDSKKDHLLFDGRRGTLPNEEAKVLEISEHNMDWLLSELGSPGRFQIISSLVLLSCMFPVIFNDLGTIFYTIPPSNSSCIISSMKYGNLSSSKFVQVDPTDLTGSCMLMNSSDSKSSCSGNFLHEFRDPEVWSIVSEWDLICDDYWMATLATTIYFLGVMCGSIAFGHLADRFGRKKCIMFCYICYLPLAFALAFSHRYWIFLTLRFFIGVFIQGVQSVCFVLVMEFCPPKYREILGGLEGVIASSAVMLLTGIAYFGKNWRYIQIAIAIPTLFALTKFFLVHESLRWQMVHGKIAAAKKNIAGILRWNKMPRNAYLEPCIDKMSYDLQLEDRLEAAYSWADCFRTPKMRRYTLAQSFMWFTLLFVFYGISFSLNEIGGNMYINLLASSAAELPAAFLATWLMQKFGRKKPLVSYYGISGLFCLIVAALTFFSQHPYSFEMETPRTVFVLLARFWLAGAFAVIYVYASELFPTVIRNTAFGICICAHTFGGVAAPQILLLGHLIHPVVPFAVFGCCCILSALLVLIQPETLNRRMPDTIAQVESNNEHDL